MAKRSMPASPVGKKVDKVKKTPTPNASARARERASVNARFNRTGAPTKKVARGKATAAQKAHVRKKIAKRVYGH
jgi:ribosomal protein L34E